MSKQPQFIPITKETFGAFLDNQIDLETLIERLRYIELQVQSEEEEETGKVLWFRFFAGDDLKTTISEVEQDLCDPSHPNYTLLLRGIAFGLENDELEVHYS